jgi:Spy/CpxP family protein refolding chaperone
MKKLFIAALLVVGMTSFAQEKKARPERAKMEQMTPEQRNQLHLKKMTLELDLNASQQKEMSKIIAEQSAKREAKMAERKATKDSVKKLTSDEIFAKKSKMLDEQIVMKERVKKILTPEQYKKWDDMKSKRHHGMKKRMMHHKDRKSADPGDKK